MSRRKASSVDYLVAVITGKSPWRCRRCGWRGRTRWSDADIVHLPDGREDGGEGDATLSALDTAPQPDRTPDLLALDRDLAIRPGDPA